MKVSKYETMSHISKASKSLRYFSKKTFYTPLFFPTTQYIKKLYFTILDFTISNLLEIIKSG